MADEPIQVRLLLQGRDCGAVVGKGGQNFTRLRQEYNVKVQMPSSQTPERVFSIDGDLENCVGVVKELLPHCSHGPYPTGQRSGQEINLLVQTDLVGTILGKGGAKIKEIREAANANIKVYGDCLPNSNERVIAIGGNDEKHVLDALSLILNILKTLPRKTAIWHYDPVSNSGGMMESNISAQAPVGQNTWRDDDINGRGNGGMPQGYSTRAGNGFGYGTQGNGDNGFTAHQGGFGNNPDQSSEFLQATTETKLTVPNDICGAIIGKGGIRIREIRTSSGAKISFSESTKEIKQDRIITITGTQQQVQSAEHLMTQAARNRNN